MTLIPGERWVTSPLGVALCACASVLVIAGCGPSTATESISSSGQAAGVTVPADGGEIQRGGASCDENAITRSVEAVGRFRGVEFERVPRRSSCADGWAAVEVEAFNGASREREVILFESEGTSWVEADRDAACGSPDQLPSGVRRLACEY